jgi:carbon-monoxide dehydrogenase medium subunit
MTMAVVDYTYHRPRTLAEALELGRTHGVDGRYLAGGTELLVDLRSRRDAASHVISLRDVPGLDTIARDDDGTLHIGALATLTAVASSPAVREALPVLAEAILRMGSVQIRNQGTIGGNFARAVPCADTPPVCLAAEASLHLAGAGGERTLPAQDFFLGPRRTVLEPGEMLVEILIPPQPARSGAAYERFQLRKGMALAVAAVAARVVLMKEQITDARIYLNAVGPLPIRATRAMELLGGQEPAAKLFAKAGALAAAAAQPIDDLRGSADFRRELVAVLTGRALAAAAERAAKGGTT